MQNSSPRHRFNEHLFMYRLIHIVPKQGGGFPPLPFSAVLSAFHLQSTSILHNPPDNNGEREGRKAAASNVPNFAEGPLDQASLPAGLPRQGGSPALRGKAAGHRWQDAPKLRTFRMALLGQQQVPVSNAWERGWARTPRGFLMG